MEKAKSRNPLDGYTERHHIVPRCLGGSNRKENLVDLTAREHYVAHRLLFMHHGTRQMAYAWFSMCRGNKHQSRNLSSRQYERAKLCMVESMKGHSFSEETRQKLRDARKRRVITDETRKKLSEVHKGRVHSPETRAKLSQSLTGRPKSEETKQKLRTANLGKTLTEEHRQKISTSLKGRMTLDNL